MSDDTPLAGRLLGELYAIEVERETGERVTAALLAMGCRVLETLTKEPPPVAGFEDRRGG